VDVSIGCPPHAVANPAARRRWSRNIKHAVRRGRGDSPPETDPHKDGDDVIVSPV